MSTPRKHLGIAHPLQLAIYQYPQPRGILDRRSRTSPDNPLLPIPHPCNLGPPHLPLQLQDAIQQCLGRGRATRDKDVDGHEPVDAPDDGIAVVVIPAAIRAAPHADHPLRIRHLVVAQAERRRHFVGDGAGDDHDIGLAGARSEDDALSVVVVAGHRNVHHLDAAAGQAERQGPEGALPGPVDESVYRCPGNCCVGSTCPQERIAQGTGRGVWRLQDMFGDGGWLLFC